ncbi:VWA domain-containing protein [Brevibacillus sp. MER 51]|uniref:vWA domain-containing protein n=1 Tax=Brevibacillus sp. MER 51 TaxID=2939560 RepID=UPI00203E0135|nr:VWA domain-containing protein [Brevibacillus sp. MER 51]MCM3145962.1 VWA domain-containing protein [Brevibacillus sp. MER 51]
MKKWASFIVFLTLVMTGCTDSDSGQKDTAATQQTANLQEQTKTPDQTTSDTSTQTQAREPLPPVKRELTAFELALANQVVGTYAGENYDEEKVKKELDKLPATLTSEQYLEELLKLLGEDYRPFVLTFANFDSSVDVHLQRPTEEITLPDTQKTHFALLIDASGSMKGKVGKKTKMEAAREAIDQFASVLPKNATISLRVYGHKGSGSEQDKALSCASTETFYSETGYQKESFQQALGKVQPAGWTPIAKALQAVQEDIPAGTNETFVYVVSDGIETCGGNPVEAAKALNQSSIKTVVNIIGFDVDNEGQRMLKQVADAGAGTYITVQDEEALKKHLRGEYDKLKQAWYAWKENAKEDALSQKEAKKKLAEDTKEKVKALVEEEKQRLLDAREYLKKRFNGKGGIMDTDSAIIDRKQEIWRYAVDTGNGLWRDSVDNGNQEWREVIEEGQQGVRDANDKKP